MSDQLPPGARALLDEAVEKGARVLGIRLAEPPTPWEPVTEEVLTAAGFLDLAARADFYERDRDAWRKRAVEDEARAERAERERDEIARSHALLLEQTLSDEREVERLNRRNEELETVRAFYADENNWTLKAVYGSSTKRDYVGDGGIRARAALLFVGNGGESGGETERC